MNDRQKNFIGQFTFLLIGVGFYVYTDFSNFEILSRNDIGSGGVPKIICILIIALSALKILLTLSNNTTRDNSIVRTNINYLKGTAIIGVLMLYCLTIKKIGFPIANVLMLFCEMCLMAPREKRNYKLFAILSVTLTGIIFTVFYYGLNLMLPTGILKTYL